eukprot:TRINITY_DN6477_c0_g1_i5.p1 TRINITY_DN6477_c0_g1~~TRINITY_DN6477_c0_g1_i5.p1  ORF type:complete len:585 (+),score=109.06 TRINITY_DN6477_c0_g1_i5:50-1804(+)
MEGFKFGSEEGDQSDASKPSNYEAVETPNDSDAPMGESDDEFDPNNTSNLHQSELVMEHHLLKTRLRAMETKLKESQDENYFSQLKAKEKERKMIELEGELNKQRSRHSDVVRQFNDLQKTCQAQMSQNLELQYHLKRSNNLNAQQQLSVSTIVTDGTEKVKKQKDLATQLLRKKRKVKELNQRMMNQMSILEERMMWQEDPINSTVGDLMESIRQRDELSRRQANRSQSVPARQQGSQLMSRSEASWDLPVHKTVLTSTDDTYIECKISTSVFGNQLRLFRESLYPVISEYKDVSDKAVTHLWKLFSNQKSSYRPKEDFFKETSSILTKSKVFLANVLRNCNHIIKEFLREEKSIKLKWQNQHRPTCHVACEADFPPPEDPLVDELKQELQMLNTRIIKIREETAAKEHNLTMEKDKAELSLRYLQRKFFLLHQEMYSSLHQVYKHRYKWVSRFPNPLRELHTKGKQPLDVKFNMHLGEVIDKDVDYLRRFGQYFTSDTTFGVDMSALCEERERARGEKREEERVRRASTKTRLEKRRASAPAGACASRSRRRTKQKKRIFLLLFLFCLFKVLLRPLLPFSSF